jgi:hypothetical protein
MGIWYEALMRWLGPATKVMAMTKVCVSQRRDADGIPRAVSIPDHVDVLCEMAWGPSAPGHQRCHGSGAKTEVWLFGSEGTLHYTPESLEGGRRGDKQPGHCCTT